MTDTAMCHPHMLTSLVIIRDRSEFSHRSTVRNVALFHVTHCGEEGARFTLDHHGFGPETTRSEILEGTAARIPEGATLITLAPRILERYIRPSLAAGDPLPPGDLQLLQRLRPDLHLLPLECRDDTLDAAGAAFSIQRASRGSSVVARARRAADEAQCVWLSYLHSLCRRSDQVFFTSAWEAWRALQRARPVPF